MSTEQTRPDDHPSQHIEVEVLTTSGSWPSSGYEDVPLHQKVRVALERAARVLGLTNWSGWIAVVAGRQIDPERSYLENGLSGRAVVDFGPVEGGGGRE